MNYEEIEQKLIHSLTEQGFKKGAESDTRVDYCKDCNDDKKFEMAVSIPKDDGNLYLVLNNGEKEDRQFICYISLHAKGENYLKENLLYLLKKQGAEHPVETADKLMPGKK